MKILVVEDDERVARFLVRALTDEGHSADLCVTGADGIAQAGVDAYDVVLLDWVLPDVDGLSVCRRLRGSGFVGPILMVTARDAVHERVVALDAGADDYLIKPFHIDELLARLRAVLRRSAGTAKLRAADLELDRLGRRVVVAGEPVKLTAREFTLLQHLVQHEGHVVTRAELLSHAWSTGYDHGANLVEVHVSNLRSKLGSRAWMIETVRGVGYRLRTNRGA